MKEKDAKALLGLMGECCCCCDDEQTTAVQTPLLPIATQPAGQNGRPGGGLSRMPTRRGVIPDEPFIPSIPSFDTPQRPSRFGMDSHIPQVTPKGAFTSQEIISDSATPFTAVLDSGYSIIPPSFHAPVVDHLKREIRGWERVGSFQQREPGANEVPMAGGNPNLNDSTWGYTLVGSGAGGYAATKWLHHTYRYDGGSLPLYGASVTTAVSGRVDLYRLRGLSGQDVTEYRLLELWALIFDVDDPGGNVYRQETRMQAMRGGLWTTIRSALDAHSGDEWKRLGFPVPAVMGEWFTRFSGDVLGYQNWPGSPAPPPTDQPFWRATGVTVTRADTSQLRPDDQLTAFGQAFTEGSWCALRGPQGETWVLHELEGTVTRVKADGTADSLERTVFEQEVLRVKSGDFLHFDRFGLTYHTWPHQWGLARCKSDFRAVTAHDPWRDSVKGRRPPDSLDPDGWYWPGRPGRPPNTVPTGAPAAPLGLALADVMKLDTGGGPT